MLCAHMWRAAGQGRALLRGEDDAYGANAGDAVPPVQALPLQRDVRGVVVDCVPAHHEECKEQELPSVKMTSAATHEDAVRLPACSATHCDEQARAATHSSITTSTSLGTCML